MPALSYHDRQATSMFDEIILRLNLGCKLASGHLSASSFDYNEPESIVSISQSLDKVSVQGEFVSQ